MVLNIFYKLRPYHPCIDAAGVFEIEGDGYVLLLMQFSLSKYSDDKSTFSSIFETAKGPECKNRKSPYTYYNNLAKNLEPLKVVYIYISPQQFFDNGSDSQAVLGSQASRNVWAGLVTGGTKTAQFVRNCQIITA